MQERIARLIDSGAEETIVAYDACHIIHVRQQQIGEDFENGGCVNGLGSQPRTCQPAFPNSFGNSRFG